MSLPQIVRAAGGRRRFRALARGALLRGQGLRGARRARGGPRPAGGRAAWARVACRAEDRADAELGFAVRRRSGRSMRARQWWWRRRVLAIEGAEGTDAMLRRVAGLPAARRPGSGGACWQRAPSPARSCASTCPPSVRARSRAGAAGLAGVAVEAGAVLLLDRDEAIRAADAQGLPSKAWPPARLGRRARPRAPAVSSAGFHPSRARAGDIEKGLAAVSAAGRRSGTGAAVVVSAPTSWRRRRRRDRCAMLSVGALRQWGCAGARRRRPACVVPQDARTEAGTLETMLAQAAAGARGRGCRRHRGGARSVSRRLRALRTPMASSW